MGLSPSEKGMITRESWKYVYAKRVEATSVDSFESVSGHGCVPHIDGNSAGQC